MEEPSPPSCATCHKLQSDLPQPLKRCAKCQTTTYCSRECQKQDWKLHKRVCETQTGTRDDPSTSSAFASTSTSNNRHNPGFYGVNALLGLDKDDYLHKLPEKVAMIQLVDCFRMRCADEYKFTGYTRGYYDGVECAFSDFQEFLDLAEKRNGLLPKWWNKEKRRECNTLATGGDPWANISVPAEKSDIMEHYSDGMMPMILRVLGEKVYGKGFM